MTEFDMQKARMGTAALAGIVLNYEGWPQTDANMELILDMAYVLPAALDRIEELEGRPKSGLYGKYLLSKADGSVVDPEADYFILRLDTDPIARMAANEYAIRTPDGKLGRELAARVTKYLHAGQNDQESWPLAKIRQLQERIADLEKALIEERISGTFSDFIPNQCHHWDYDEEPFCVELDGPCEYKDGKCSITSELQTKAREQLQAEGKI